MAGCEFAVLVAEKGCFGGQYRKVGANRKLFACRKLAFEDSKARLVQNCCRSTMKNAFHYFYCLS